MFISTLERWDTDKKYLPDIFDLVISFLKSVAPETIESGTYPIQGSDIFAKVECGTGKAEKERRFELHYPYIDVQMLLTGHERQDFAAAIPQLSALEDRLDTDDITFYDNMPPSIPFVYIPGCS